MIVVLLGTQKFKFNRLIDEILNLKVNGVIKDKVFIQSGHNEVLIPQTHKGDITVKPFLDKEPLLKMIEESSLVISHGGTSSIISALKLNKKVIVVPRLKKFKEHVDDHQLEIVNYFKVKKYIVSVENIDELGSSILSLSNNMSLMPYKQNSESLIKCINQDIVFLLERG